MTRKMIYENEEVVYIEYRNKLPFSVLTAPLSGGGLSTFDFECIGNSKTDIRYYESGGGGSKLEINKPSEGTTFWLADDCKFIGKRKLKNCIQLSKPLYIRGYHKRSINPFKIAIPNSYGFEYCKICDAFYTRDEGCQDHHTWSDERGCFMYEDGTLAD